MSSDRNCPSPFHAEHHESSEFWGADCSAKATQRLAGWLVSWKTVSWKNAVCWRTAALSCPIWFAGWERRSLHVLPVCLERRWKWQSCPRYSMLLCLGLFWHSHGCFPGVYWWYRGEPNGSGCHRNNPFVEVIAPPASKTEDTLCDWQSTALRFCGAFCEAQAHFLYQVILLPFQWVCGHAGSGCCFSLAVGGCCVCSALLDTGQVIQHCWQGLATSCDKFNRSLLM